MPKRRRDVLLHGLTWQEEKFCRYYVSQYANLDDDGDDKNVAMVAYRMAYNCSPTAKDETHKRKAKDLLKKAHIEARVKEIRKALGEYVDISCAEMVSKNVKALNLDPLELTIFDEKRQRYRLRYMHEIRKDIRDVIPYRITSNGLILPDVDRNKIMDRLIKILGFESAKEVNVNASIVGNEWTILPEGFVSEDEEEGEGL